MMKFGLFSLFSSKIPSLDILNEQETKKSDSSQIDYNRNGNSGKWYCVVAAWMAFVQ